MNGVEIKKGKLGQNVLAGEDSISGMVIIFDDAVAHSLVTVNTAYAVYTLADVATLGISSAHGAIYRDIVEFYRIAGEGTKLWLYGVDTSVPTNGTTLSALINAGKIEDFINQTSGEIRQLTVSTNAVDKAFATTKVNGVLTDISTSIPLLQQKCNDAFEAGRPFNAILPCPKVTSISGLEHFRDSDTDVSENISLVVATDPVNFVGSPLVGTILGTIAIARVNENIGKVESFRIDNPLTNLLTSPTIGNSIKVKTLSDADQKTLSEKGYIFLLEYTDYTGVYWSDDPTLAKEVLDTDGNMNPSSILKGRTLGKALRLARRSLIPKLKKNYALDPTTGKLPSSTIKLLETETEQAIDIMANEISGREVKINPNSNLLTGEKALELTRLVVVPHGVVGVVKGNINLVKNI